jgi:hypothetical protein
MAEPTPVENPVTYTEARTYIEARTYTVAELIAALQTLKHQDVDVNVFSGCHGCGGELVEIYEGDIGDGPYVGLSGTQARDA